MINMHPHIMLLLLLLFGGSAVMCGSQAGDSLLKGGKCTDVRTPCKPPVCTSWNICRTGTSHLKGVQHRADTTERYALHRTHHLGDKRASRCCGTVEAAAHNNGFKNEKSRCETGGTETYRSLCGRREISFQRHFL